MSHAYSKTHYCKVCNWSGYHPEYIKTEKQDGDITIHNHIPICPQCMNEIPIKNIK